MCKIMIAFFYIYIYEKTTSSNYRGVCWYETQKKWKATVNHNNKKMHLGYFENEKDAAMAVNFKCKELTIPMRNPGVGVLDYKSLKQITKVIGFFIFHFVILV